MAKKGKTQLLITWVASPDKVSEMDRLVESHGSWMAKTHDRDGANALLSYDIAKGPELENPLDPSSISTHLRKSLGRGAGSLLISPRRPRV